MGKKNEGGINNEDRIEAVLNLLKKQASLTLKQKKFCNNACVERFLKAKGENVKKAAKHLHNCLSWRHSFGTDNLMADEFCAELNEGMAYVAGHDHQLRPVMIFRIKQDYQKFHSQKLFTRLLVFTLEVAIQTMSKNVEQFVILFDASFFRSASGFMNMLVATLKMIGDYYPGRLHKAFIIHPPSLFSYLWKGVRPFVELSSLVVIMSSLDIEEMLRLDDVASYPRATSAAKLGTCSSSRFAFTVSHDHFDSVKPWYLSLKETSGPKFGPINLCSNLSSRNQLNYAHAGRQTNLSHAFSGPKISPLNARSYSFASPLKKGFFPSTPMPEKTQSFDVKNSRNSKPTFLQSPALFFQRDREAKPSESFVPFLKFYQVPYDEMIYRSKMRPPLGGLISIVSPQIRRRHVSISQRF